MLERQGAAGADAADLHRPVGRFAAEAVRAEVADRDHVANLERVRRSICHAVLKMKLRTISHSA
jgi:hypothetical protein